MNGRPWSPHEVMRARAMRKNGVSYSDIDRSLARPIGTTSQKLNEPEPSASGHHVSSKDIPAAVLADRDARREAADRRDRTQEFFGDPAPGFSALDRKRAAEKAVP